MVRAAQVRHYFKDRRNTKPSAKIVTSPNAKLIMPSRFPISNQRLHMLTVGSSMHYEQCYWTKLLVLISDMIQDRALTYWYEINVPKSPPFPKPATQIPPETLAHRLGLGLSSDDEACFFYYKWFNNWFTHVLPNELLIKPTCLSLYKYIADLLWGSITSKVYLITTLDHILLP